MEKMMESEKRKTNSFADLGKSMGIKVKDDCPDKVVFLKEIKKNQTSNRNTQDNYILQSLSGKEYELDEGYINLEKNKKDSSILKALLSGAFFFVQLEDKNNKPIAKNLDEIFFRIPKETRILKKKDNNDTNPVLELNRYCFIKENKPTFYSKNELLPKFIFNKKQIDSIALRHLSNTKSILGESNVSKPLDLSLDWRLALGLGNESVYETSITLHHIYGIPYIPASAIKGITRSWIITNCFDSKEGNKSDGALSNKLFCHIFGSPKDSVIGEHQGNIIFFDAFPKSAPNIEPDIMNNHYSDYYDGKGSKPPADYYNPNPIFFLTVKNTSFQFIVGIKKETKIKDLIDTREEILKDLTHYSIQNESMVAELKEITQESSLLDLACAWLKFALTEHGIGAKTAVGYGYMK